MWALILIFYIQTGLQVDVVSAKLNGEYGTLAACEKETPFQTKSLPTQDGEAARWQYAVCVHTISKGSE